MPIKRSGLARQIIKTVQIDDSYNWRKAHLRTLQMEYAKAPYRDDLMSIVEEVYALKTTYCSELNIFAAEKIANYFSFSCQFVRSSDFKMPDGKCEKLLSLIRAMGGDIYITGLGGLNYMDYQLFETNHVHIKFMDYQSIAYPQQHGTFDPFVSILDLIANLGKEGKYVINSQAIYWKEFTNPKTQKRITIG